MPSALKTHLQLTKTGPKQRIQPRTRLIRPCLLKQKGLLKKSIRKKTSPTSLPPLKGKTLSFFGQVMKTMIEDGL